MLAVIVLYTGPLDSAEVCCWTSLLHLCFQSCAFGWRQFRVRERNIGSLPSCFVCARLLLCIVPLNIANHLFQHNVNFKAFRMKRPRDGPSTMPDLSHVVSGLAGELIEMLGSGEAPSVRTQVFCFLTFQVCMRRVRSLCCISATGLV